jgi:hypothetical protein
MKMSSDRIERALTQFEALVLPEDHPAVPQLHDLFGEHTFFLDRNGLHIVEPAGATPAGAPTGKVVRLASWTDSEQTSLATHEPRPTDVVIVLSDGGETAH